MFNDFFKSSIKIGREYSHWIDLRLISHMEVVIYKNLSHQTPIFIKSDVFGVTSKSKNVQKGPAAPTPFFCKNKREGGRAETKNAGVKKFSSFIWTLVVKKENGPIGPYMGRTVLGRMFSPGP